MLGLLVMFGGAMLLFVGMVACAIWETQRWEHDNQMKRVRRRTKP